MPKDPNWNSAELLTILRDTPDPVKIHQGLVDQIKSSTEEALNNPEVSKINLQINKLAIAEESKDYLKGNPDVFNSPQYAELIIKLLESFQSLEYVMSLHNKSKGDLNILSSLVRLSNLSKKQDRHMLPQLISEILRLYSTRLSNIQDYEAFLAKNLEAVCIYENFELIQTLVFKFKRDIEHIANLFMNHEVNYIKARVLEEQLQITPFGFRPEVIFEQSSYEIYLSTNRLSDTLLARCSFIGFCVDQLIK